MNKILRKTALLLVASVLTIGFASCKDDDADSVSSSQQNVVLEQEDVRAAFEIRSNTSWKAECIGLNEDGSRAAKSWFMLTPSSGLGTQQVALDVLTSNQTTKARKGRILVTCSNGQKYQIEVSQRGLTGTDTYITPEQIGLEAAASTGNFFTVGVGNIDAEIVVVPKTSGAAWLKNLVKSNDLSYGYLRKETWKFDVDANTMSDSRTAELGVTIKFGYRTYNYTVTVTQNGLGAPSIKTASDVYMNCAQTSHTQTIWLEGGNQNNVEYTVTSTSAYQGVDNETGWITDAKIVNNQLVIAAAANTDDNAREGSVLIVAHRPGATQGLYTTSSVKVVQAGHKSAGIVMPTSEVTHDFTAGEYTLPTTLLNKSTVKSILTNNEDMFASNPSFADNQLTYTLTKYNGAQGDYREGVISLLVSNGNSNNAIVSLKVRQYAPGMPAISIPVNTITDDYTAKDGQLPLNAINASIIEVDANVNWLDVQYANGQLIYSLEEYEGTGSQGDFREGIVTIAASNDHANIAYYYVTIRQYTAMLPALSLPNYIGVGYKSQTVDLPISFQGGRLELVSCPEWVAVNGATPELRSTTRLYDEGGIEIEFEENSGSATTNYMRDGFITFKYSKANLSAYYYLQLRQYARGMAFLSGSSVSWTWRNYYYGGYGYDSYAPRQAAQTVTALNLPQVHTITTSNSNDDFSSWVTNSTISVSPVTWEYGNGINKRKNATIYVYITGYPYTQTLTFGADAYQKYELIGN